MKKLFKTLAALAVVAALGFGFVSCGGGDDDSSSGGGGSNSNSALAIFSCDAGYDQRTLTFFADSTFKVIVSDESEPQAAGTYKFVSGDWENGTISLNATSGEKQETFTGTKTISEKKITFSTKTYTLTGGTLKTPSDSTASETKKDDTTKATDDTTTANQVAANAVIAKINAIGTVTYTAESKAKIDEALSAYNALNDAQKALVTNFGTLKTAESTYDSWTSAGGMTVTISPNSAIAITKADAERIITLSASTGFTGYSWRINGKPTESTSAASVSSDGTRLTLTKAQLSDGVVYQIALSAEKNGIPYGTQITVSK